MTVTFADGFVMEYHGEGFHVYVGTGAEGSDMFLEGADVPQETNRLFAQMGRTLRDYREAIIASLR